VLKAFLVEGVLMFQLCTQRERERERERERGREGES